jgi:hypothetical protein
MQRYMQAFSSFAGVQPWLAQRLLIKHLNAHLNWFALGSDRPNAIVAFRGR